MRRELKFRAWDLRENKWRYHYEEIGGFNIQGELILFGEFGSDLPLERFLNDVVIQQYTGLKGKNGVEIYEGDIIRSRKFYFEVRWINAAFHLVNRTEFKYGPRHYAMSPKTVKSMEVIANIFEPVAV